MSKIFSPAINGQSNRATAFTCTITITGTSLRLSALIKQPSALMRAEGFGAAKQGIDPICRQLVTTYYTQMRRRSPPSARRQQHGPATSSSPSPPRTVGEGAMPVPRQRDCRKSARTQRHVEKLREKSRTCLAAAFKHSFMWMTFCCFHN